MQLQSYNSKPNETQNGDTTPVTAIQNWLLKELAEKLSVDVEAIDTREPLTRYGLDSIDAVTLVGDLEDWLESELPSTLFWDYPTIEQSARYLVAEFDVSAALEDPEPEPPSLTSCQR